MRVAFVSGLGTVWGSYSPRVLAENTGKTVAGGEAAFLETAFALAARGHDVTAFYPGEPDRYLDVGFEPLERLYPGVLTDSYDAIVSWSDEAVLRAAPRSVHRIFIQQLNDLPTGTEFWRAVDVIMPASATHGRFLAGFAPQEACVAWLPLYAGVRPERFVGQMPYGKRPHQVGWWSSPDRGLHHLLYMWPKVKALVPDARLVVAYHLWRLIESARTFYRAGEVAWRLRALERMVVALKDVEFLGAIPRTELVKHQIKTKVQAYTYDPVCFTEGFAAALSDGIAAGCHVIARSEDALPEIYGRYVEWVDAPVCDDDWHARFTDRIVAALLADRHPLDPGGQKKQEFAKCYTWDACAVNVEKALSLRPAE